MYYFLIKSVTTRTWRWGSEKPSSPETTVTRVHVNLTDGCPVLIKHAVSSEQPTVKLNDTVCNRQVWWIIFYKTYFCMIIGRQSTYQYWAPCFQDIDYIIKCLLLCNLLIIKSFIVYNISNPMKYMFVDSL